MHEAIICPLNFILASNPPSLRLSFCRACLKAAGINIQPVRTPQTVEPALELQYYYTAFPIFQARDSTRRTYYTRLGAHRASSSGTRLLVTSSETAGLRTETINPASRNAIHAANADVYQNHRKV